MKKAALFVLVGALCGPKIAEAQGTVDPSHGVIAVDQLLRRLGSVKRVLVIGAHPDDEDTGLLATLARGEGVDAAYLALNRGEGGQNLIGPELGVGLGLLRTRELLAARRLDGARQYFTRAYDFGYSKSAEETFRFWPRDSLLADVVYVVRRFRPQIIVSIFTGTRRDGHGHHEAAGILAREAFDVAGDSSRFPEQLSGGLRPWTPLKLYRSARFDTAAATLRIETGRLDPVLGRSYHQIAMASRSQHRSQDMGRIESLGPAQTSLQLLESRVATRGANGESSIFEGIDTTLTGLLTSIARPDVHDPLTEQLIAYGMRLERAREVVGRAPTLHSPERLSAALSSLNRSVELARAAGVEAADLLAALNRDQRRLESTLLEAAGVIVDAFSDDDLVVPRQEIEVEVQIWNGGSSQVELRSVSLRTPSGWTVETLGEEAQDISAGSLSRHRFRLRVPENAELTQPYFLRAPRAGAIYTWPPGADERGEPFDTPLLEARVELAVAGSIVRRSVEVVNRFADQARGEVRRPLYVVPAVSLTVTPATSVWPVRSVGGLGMSVGVRGDEPAGVDGRLWIEAPPGWRVTPRYVEFELSGPGRTASFDFEVEPPSDVLPAVYEVKAVAETPDGRQYRVGYSTIDYPHIRRTLFFEAATARVSAFELEVESQTAVAFVPGAGDDVANAIRGIGTKVDVLDERAVASGDLSRYEVIVLGIRAYETNPTLVASNDRLLDWVRAGGTLIVQYQQYGFFRGDYAPYPLRARFPHDRVSDEHAPVTLLIPDHPVFNRPNRIGPSDFEGWVQERGLYFPSEWDDHYRALLETSDPGEPPKLGALLVAEYGKGLYVYTGLSLFRQLPSGVPGAYRLLANLLSLRG